MDHGHRRGDERKDLQDLKNLSPSALGSFARKLTMPLAPRSKGKATSEIAFQDIKVFTSSNRWAWIWQYLRHRLGPRHCFPVYDDPARDNGVYRLEGDADEIRVALAGDWGTGTDEAYEVAERMVAFNPHWSIHLGDVYFVGDATEVRENFLGKDEPVDGFKPCCWPPGSRGTFALNGNHEMLARGFGYFDLMLPQLGLNENGKPRGQKASFFCLENEHWRVIALDTGYRSIGLPIIENLPILVPDCALPTALMDWLRDTVFSDRNDTRGIILLSHHQYYSRFDSWYTRQAIQLSAFIKRPVLWFWGHEHRLAVYKPHGIAGGIKAFGRCIGHGGMPIDLPPSHAAYPECETEFLDDRLYPNNENLKVGYNGFARLTVRGPVIAVEYVDLFDKVLFTERWTVDADGAVLPLSGEAVA